MSEKIPFHELTFDKFRQLAQSEHLSRHEKVGFPNEYREGKEELIFADVLAKLRSLEGESKTILEIGPGCSHLPVMLAAVCKERWHRLHFVDSPEMLALLPEEAFIHKWPGRYPDDVHALFAQLNGRVDTIIAYSVIQYVFAEGNLWDFLDRSLSLLADGGEILLGDVPNITMRKRFFSSPAGAQCHREYTGRDELPEVRFNQIEPGQIDDSVVLAILARARAQGFHAWVVPQREDLPMANRREDILIRKP
jgi:hypothetical protein